MFDLLFAFSVFSCKPEDFVAVHLSAKKKNNQVFVAKVRKIYFDMYGGSCQTF